MLAAGALAPYHAHCYHRNRVSEPMADTKRNPPPAASQALTDLVGGFLADLRQANHSPHTVRAYAGDLAQFTAFLAERGEGITVDSLRAFWHAIADRAPATRARKQACLSRFLAWAFRHGFVPANPMEMVDRVRREPPVPRGVARAVVDKVVAAIPGEEKRDRLLFTLLAETGLRIGEALALHVEDMRLDPDDEHLRVCGKGGRVRTVLLDDPRLVRQLRAYLKLEGYRHGPVFRAEKNGRGGPLRYQSAQAKWSAYCAAAGVRCTLHQLRHTHATELVNAGVSLATIRKRLGHKSLQTTLRYAEQSDATADAEVRAWRRNTMRRS